MKIANTNGWFTAFSFSGANRRHGLMGWVATGLALLMMSGGATSAERISEQAAAVLRSTVEHLSRIDHLRFGALLTEESVFNADHKLQFEGSMVASVRRPSSFTVTLETDYHNRSYWLHDGFFTVFDKDVNVFAQIAAGGTLSEAFDVLSSRYDADVPMSDLLSGRAYEMLVGQASSVSYVGLGHVDEYRCHHIAGRTNDLDWQIWIRSEGDPWLCKYIITDRSKALAPQFVLRFRDWEIVTGQSATDFELRLPADAEKIEFIQSAAGE